MNSVSKHFTPDFINHLITFFELTNYDRLGELTLTGAYRVEDNRYLHNLEYVNSTGHFYTFYLEYLYRDEKRNKIYFDYFQIGYYIDFETGDKILRHGESYKKL